MNIRIEGLDELERDFEKAANMIPELSKTAMDKSTQRIKNTTQGKIVSEGITFQGGLQQSVYAKVPNSFRGEVYVGKKYGLYVEQGTRPHWPPVDAIEKWARLKLGQPGAGFVIARSIARKGTKAHPFFEPSVRESMPYVEKTFSDIPKVMVKIMAGNYVTR